MSVLVTGAHGRLGRSLMQLDTATELIGAGRTSQPVGGRDCHKIDLTDPDAVRSLLETLRPTWVIHTAALTDVDRCETERQLARRINVDTVEHLIEACRQIDAGLVQLSTDYVFDGRRGPYAEEDATAPLCYYGQLKLESEAILLASGIRGFVLRTLWLYGYVPGARPNQVTWALEALAAGRPLDVVDDQWGNPTYVQDLAHGLLELCHKDAAGILHWGGSTYLTRYEMLVRLAHSFNLDHSLLTPIPTVAARQKASRPLRSGLRSSRASQLLGRPPMDFAEGLDRMRRNELFRRDFPGLF